MEIMSSSSRFPFTSTQWQELEHQALVYKYMISGMPIPPDLLFSIQRSLDSSTRLIMHHHSPHLPIGRDYFQMGFGRKIDPEPGRCRRTDGKKWRCSKEVYPDSKYCERHMHRGRNRSRKPVEANSLSTASTPPLSSIKSQTYPSPFGYPQLSSSSRSPGINVLSSQDRFLLESSPYSHSEKDHSFVMKEDVDEHRYLSESGTISASMSDSWHLEPLAMKSSPLAQSQSKQLSFSDYQNESYSYQNTSALKQDQGGCYDQLALKVEIKDEPQKVMHHFFDEAPHDGDKDSSTTQLSISVPDCARDFFLARNGNFTILIIEVLIYWCSDDCVTVEGCGMFSRGFSYLCLGTYVD
ncbi:growth-regulating factor 3-like [Bidens hawaiensis]|uniref:growth-regulating factor 3-like n=1 Tax=Bidens hawaiensis TaxID=980011 RepID=UPI00404915DE